MRPAGTATPADTCPRVAVELGEMRIAQGAERVGGIDQQHVQAEVQHGVAERRRHPKHNASDPASPKIALVPKRPEVRNKKNSKKALAFHPGVVLEVRQSPQPQIVAAAN